MKCGYDTFPKYDLCSLVRSYHRCWGVFRLQRIHELKCVQKKKRRDFLSSGIAVQYMICARPVRVLVVCYFRVCVSR